MVDYIITVLLLSELRLTIQFKNINHQRNVLRTRYKPARRSELSSSTGFTTVTNKYFAFY